MKALKRKNNESFMSKKFKRLFVKYFIPYLIIIVIFIFVSTYSYQKACSEIEKNIVAQQHDYLHQSKTYLDNVFQYMHDIAKKILSKSSIVNFAVLTKEQLRNNYFSSVELLNEIDDIVIDYSYIDNYYVIYKNSEQVILNGKSITDFHSFYNYQFSYDNYSSDAFSELLFDKIYLGGKYFPIATTTQLDKRKEAMIMIQTISFGFEGASAVILFVIDYDEIQKYMLKNNSLASTFSILDKANQVIAEFSSHRNKSDDAKDYLNNQVNSDITDLKYVLNVEKASAYKRLNDIKILNNWLYLILILTNFIISYYFAKKYSKPVIQLVHEHDELSTKMLEQKITFRQSFLEKWLYGNFQNQKEAENMANCINESYIGMNYCVVLIDIEPNNWLVQENSLEEAKKINTLKENLKDIIIPIVNKDFICDVTQNSLAIIIVSAESTNFQNNVMTKIRLCKKQLDNRGLERTLYTIGSIEHDILQVSRSFSTAKDTLIRAINSLNSTERIVCYDMESQTEGLYYYPCEVESRLINCVQVGNGQDVRKILKEIYQENIFTKNLSSEMIVALIYELCGTYIKLHEKIAAAQTNPEIDNDINIIKNISQLDLLNQLQYIQKSFLKLSNQVEEEKNDTYSKLMHDMMNYIHSNYQKSDLGLSLLAQEFNFTEVYISQLFKNFYDTSFINYLQSLRMEKTRHLLSTTDLPVKEIMALVGYNSMNTFARAFKRMNGITATEYRKREKNS